MWIASTVKPAADDDIRQLEDFYRRRSVGGEVAFPRNYPTGCLLGCVEVVDVLPQEEYRLQHPHGESESPYVFVCASPHELFIKFPVKGQHKICEPLSFVLRPSGIPNRNSKWAVSIWQQYGCLLSRHCLFTRSREEIRSKGECKGVKWYSEQKLRMGRFNLATIRFSIQ